MRVQKSVLLAVLLLGLLGIAALYYNFFLVVSAIKKTSQEQSRGTLDTKIFDIVTDLPVVDVVLIIHAGNLHKDRRDAIRESWMLDANKVPNLKLVVKFFIGTANETAEEKAQWGIAEEAEKYGDIVMLDTVRDAYQTIMHKGREAFRWYVEHYRFRFLLKTDDDCYMNLRLIPEIIAPFPLQNSWGGFFMAGPVVFGHHKVCQENCMLFESPAVVMFAFNTPCWLTHCRAPKIT